MLIDVRLDGQVVSLEAEVHLHEVFTRPTARFSALKPVLPPGEWVEVTGYTSDMPEYVSIGTPR